MYIYLDESYNLKDRDKKQFISINGFFVLNEKTPFKKWSDYRHRYAKNKKRIHANNKLFDRLRNRALKLILQQPTANLISVVQAISDTTSLRDKNYFYKDKLNFDRVYFDMVIALLKQLNLSEYREVKIVIDSRKHKHGELGKKFFIKKIISYLEDNYKQTKFIFKVQPSSTDILLELADFVSNIFYREYAAQNNKLFNDIKSRLIQIKNPLSD